MLSPEKACELVQQLPSMKLLAVDGLPCSGKSTLVTKMAARIGLQVVAVDDFFLPKSMWPRPITPSFPFPHYRYEVFLATVRELATTGRCEYLPFDWDSMEISQVARSVILSAGPVAVEGTSGLHPEIAPLFDLRFFVESDERSTLEAILKRDGSYFEEEWRTLWLPSSAIYMETEPQLRADFLVRGRGIPGLED